jgi:hypothetical protein
MQQALKPLARKAWARVVAAQLFQQFNITAANAAQTAFDPRLARKTAPALRTALESWADRRNAFDRS